MTPARSSLRLFAGLAALAAIPALLSGCMAFPSNAHPEFEGYPSIQGRQIVGALDLEYVQTVNGYPTDALELDARDFVLRTAVEEFHRAGYFARVSSEPALADLNVKIRFSNEGTYNHVLRLITGATLFLVPNRSTDRFVVEAEATDSSGRSLGVYRLEDSVVQWQSLFLLPATPFRRTSVVTPLVVQRIFQHLILDMATDGTLGRVATESSDQRPIDLDAPPAEEEGAAPPAEHMHEEVPPPPEEAPAGDAVEGV